jgi:hypothetical protein
MKEEVRDLARQQYSPAVVFVTKCADRIFRFLFCIFQFKE